MVNVFLRSPYREAGYWITPTAHKSSKGGISRGLRAVATTCDRLKERAETIRGWSATEIKIPLPRSDTIQADLASKSGRLTKDEIERSPLNIVGKMCMIQSRH